MPVELPTAALQIYILEEKLRVYEQAFEKMTRDIKALKR